MTYRIAAVFGRRANGPDEHGYEHGGRNPLPATSPTTTSRPFWPGWQHLEEIATDLACRLIDGIHRVAREGLSMLGHDHLLDLAGCGHFRLQHSLFGTGLDVPPALADEDVNKARIAQTDGNNRRDAIEIQAAFQGVQFAACIHLMELRRIWISVRQC